MRWEGSSVPSQDPCQMGSLLAMETTATKQKKFTEVENRHQTKHHTGPLSSEADKRHSQKSKNRMTSIFCSIYWKKQLIPINWFPWSKHQLFANNCKSRVRDLDTRAPSTKINPTRMRTTWDKCKRSDRFWAQKTLYEQRLFYGPLAENSALVSVLSAAKYQNRKPQPKLGEIIRKSIGPLNWNTKCRVAPSPFLQPPPYMAPSSD